MLSFAYVCMHTAFPDIFLVVKSANKECGSESESRPKEPKSGKIIKITHRDPQWLFLSLGMIDHCDWFRYIIIYIYTHTRSESNIEPPTARLHAASEQMRADDSGVKYISLRYTSLRICNL